MEIFKNKKVISLLMLVMLVVMISLPVFASTVQPTVNLGSTEDYAVLAGSTITNIGTSSINGSVGGNVGLYPGTEITGMETLTVSGTVHLTDVAAKVAKDDLVTAYNDAMGRSPVKTIGSELGGMTLTPGIYDSLDGKFSITGTLTLDAQGDPEAVFVFKSASTLITASASNVNLINSARFCRTFWGVGSSATLGSNSNFVGHILAAVSITANTGATIQGQLLAQIGAVTLDSNTITNGICEEIIEPEPIIAPIEAAPLSATLHIIKHVINNNNGTAVASDFNLHVKFGGIDVAQSPGPGAESPGTTYILDAGAYNISEDAVNGYTLNYSGDSDAVGNIVLTAGDEKVVMLINDDNSSISTPVNATVPGGQLPNTATPWYNFLFLGIVLIFGSVIGLINFRKA